MLRTNNEVFVVWIDHEKAKLFEFSDEKMERTQLHSRYVDHHTHVLDRLDQEQREQKFYSEVSQHLPQANSILIIGPGDAKVHFQNHLTRHHPVLAKKVVACETVDHPTDPQIAAMARKLFRWI